MSLDGLRVRLHQLRVDAAGQMPRKFVPDGELEKVLVREEVIAVLREDKFGIPAHKRENISVIVVREGLKVFAILVILGLEPKLEAFIENDRLDSRLPFTETELDDIVPGFAPQFEQLQWEYLAYRFRKEHFHRNIESRQILPYVREEILGGGGFSTVYKIAVHPNHQDWANLDQGEPPSLVRKEIKTVGLPKISDAARVAEMNMLFLLRRHDNIVKLLAAYTHNSVPNLLFPAADMDLHSFLLEAAPPAGFETKTAFFAAMHGLAQGLNHLHNFHLRSSDVNNEFELSGFGYHHDIKPRNILVKKTSFILADFGLSSLKPTDQDSETYWKDATIEYGAPECRNNVTFSAKKVGRAIDIWSLGCVFCEVGTYMELGANGIQRFRKERELEGRYGTHRCFHHDERLSPKVDTWIKEMEDVQSGKPVAGFFNFARTLLDVRPDRRPRSNEIVEGFGYLTLEELFELSITRLDNYASLGKQRSDRNLHEIRIRLEKNRLLAWAWVLGLVTLWGGRQPHNKQAYTLHSQFYGILQSLADVLVKARDLVAENSLSRFILNTLDESNESLYCPLDEKAKSSVDNAFRILSTANEEVQPLQDVQTVALGISGSWQYQQLGATAAVKYMSLLASQHAHSTGRGTTIQPSLVAPYSYVGRHQLCWLTYGYKDGERKMVLVEWKGYGRKWMQDTEDDAFKARGEEMFIRIQELSAMLERKPKPNEFRVLDCLGSLHNPQDESFGLVYDMPVPDGLPVMLHSLLQIKKRPNLNDKFALANALAASVHGFHIAGWVHKNISSYNIIFFPDRGGVHYAEPYLVGFYHSRQDRRESYTEGPSIQPKEEEYQHPTYQKGSGRYQKAYDYYSLGLVLLEIGLWRSLDVISSKFPTHSPEALRDEYIKLCETALNEYMGEVYHEVTLACLQETFEYPAGDEGEDNPSKIHLEFQSKVMSKLGNCRV